ncbi:MAG: hypothetical protein IPH39_00025 [Sulfuritalea sp.]|nr:hypothetical protein [Sulfuritalea sp.]
MLGLNSDTGFLGARTPSVLSAACPPTSKWALDSVLAGKPAAAKGGDLVLQELLARAVSSASSGLDRARSATAVVNATGVLRSRSADTSLKGAGGLATINLGLAATAIDAGVAATGNRVNANLLSNSSSDSNTLGLNRALTSNLEQATAELDAGRPRRRSAAQAGASDLLLSGVSLLTAAADVLAIDAEPALLADQLAQATKPAARRAGTDRPTNAATRRAGDGRDRSGIHRACRGSSSAPSRTQAVTGGREANNARARRNALWILPMAERRRPQALSLPPASPPSPASRAMPRSPRR